MKIKSPQILTFSIVPPPIEFKLNIVEFNPAIVFGSGWKFADEINGLSDNDGITAFETAIVKAAPLPEDEGSRLLFHLRRVAITGEERITSFANFPLVDPNLLWSLYNQEGQKILRYFYKTYRIAWIEVLRRILLSPTGDRYSLYLHMLDNSMWHYNRRRLAHNRHADDRILSLGCEPS